MAWLALMISLLALAVAVSDKPWLREMAARYRQNLSTLISTVRESRENRAAAADPAELVRQASRDVRLEESSAARRNLEEAARSLAVRAERMTGAARRTLSQLASETARLGEALSEGSRGARDLTALAERIESALTTAPSASER